MSTGTAGVMEEITDAITGTGTIIITEMITLMADTITAEMSWFTRGTVTT